MEWLKSLLGMGTPRSASQRDPRVSLGPLHRASFVSELGEMDLINLSVTGVAFCQTSLKKWPKVGKHLEGTLKLANSNLSVRLEIVHMTDKIVGCRFDNNLETLSHAVTAYFDVELSAHHLEDHSADAEAEPRDEDEPEGKKHWYVGPNNCELFFIESPDGGVLRFNLIFFGNSFEGGEDISMRYGQILQKEGELDPTAKIVRWDSCVPRHLKENAMRFLKGVKFLNERQRGALIEFVERAPEPPKPKKKPTNA